jgi:myo-inositol-1-phosphate synthase
MVRINYYPPKGDEKEGWDNINFFGWMGYKMELKINILCKDSILAAPIVLDLALFMDAAAQAGQRGVIDWLGFYFKEPMTRDATDVPVHHLNDPPRSLDEASCRGLGFPNASFTEGWLLPFCNSVVD